MLVKVLGSIVMLGLFAVFGCFVAAIWNQDNWIQWVLTGLVIGVFSAGLSNVVENARERKDTQDFKEIMKNRDSGSGVS